MEPPHLRPSETDAWLDLFSGCRDILAGLVLSLLLLVVGLWAFLLLMAKVLS